ncbi:hypothetical protein MMC08_008146, partial [Hypocenomyce scalaris]|nr:hypothetical protein [Hypocenomyce scalaris]
PALATALRPNSSITVSNYVYFQDPSDNIMGIPMNGSAETAYWGAPFTVGNEQAMPGTNIGVQFALDSSPSAHVFFQLNGSDVSEFSTSNTAGTWTMTEMPVD